MDNCLTREEVYEIIDTERDYQDQQWGDSRSSGEEGQGERTLDEFSLYIYGYAKDLLDIASHSGEKRNKLEFIRKVTALGVSCMEQHGAIPRFKSRKRKETV